MGVQFFGTDHTRPHPRAPGFYCLVEFPVDDPRTVGWSSDTARRLFRLLGLSPARADGSLGGEVPLADARRAVLRARAALPVVGPALARPEHATYGPPRARPDGAIELRPLRTWSPALTVDDLRRRLEALAAAVDGLAARGATHLAWA